MEREDRAGLASLLLNYTPPNPIRLRPNRACHDLGRIASAWAKQRQPDKDSIAPSLMKTSSQHLTNLTDNSRSQLLQKLRQNR